MNLFSKYVNPYLGKMLENIKMDKEFVRGKGCYLYDNKGEKYLDCIAAYGALPFGYNPEEIWECILDFHNTMEPSFIQPSAMSAASQLAESLLHIVPEGLAYVTFTNSGAEAVEAAIKLCRSASNKKGILGALNSFHGKTLGALSATGKESYQSGFGAPVEGFNYIPYGDLKALEEELRSKPNYYAAFIVEPIQGEGGIVEPPAGYLKNVRRICSSYGVLLIVDEIQTGLGRTGEMFVCDEEGICPDVLLIAKALGGGIFPIGACICTPEVYNENFALKHSSTFAGNSLSCRVGLRVIDILTSEDRKILKDVKSRGEFLKSGLLRLKEKYPHLISSIRGRGLMLGIQFGINRNTFPGSLIGIMAEQELLTPVISSYLLNVEHIRVAPTLNGSDVIRIEPPLNISERECQRALDGIENMLSTLEDGNTARFLSYLIDIKDNERFHKVPIKASIKISPEEEDGRFAFLVHPLDLSNYPQFDESLSGFKDEELERLTNMWNDMVDPFVVSSVRIKSKCGKTAYGDFIVIPRTADEFIKAPREEVLRELKVALKLAKDRGAKIVGLGAYTSVASGGGLYLKNEGVAITTGNSYTVASAIEAITTSLKLLGSSSEYATAAVVGAAGSIGRGASILVSERVSKLILIGNPENEKSSFDRLLKIAGEIYKYTASLIKDNKPFIPGSLGYKLSKIKELPDWSAPTEDFINFARLVMDKYDLISITTSIDEALPLSDIVISATNTPQKLITPSNLKRGAIVCELSRPSNVREDVKTLRPDVLVIDGGVIEVPGLPDLGWNFGFDRGHAYACMSETMMLALEKHYVHTSLGSTGVSVASILYTKQLAEKHGFKLANLKSFNKPVTEERWRELLSSIKHPSVS